MQRFTKFISCSSWQMCYTKTRKLAQKQKVFASRAPRSQLREEGETPQWGLVGVLEQQARRTVFPNEKKRQKGGISKKRKEYLELIDCLWRLTEFNQLGVLVETLGRIHGRCIENEPEKQTL